jgi:hypothetical protein
MFQNLHLVMNLELLQYWFFPVFELGKYSSLSIKSIFQIFDRFKNSFQVLLSYIECLHHKMQSLLHACQQVLYIFFESSSSISTRTVSTGFIHVSWSNTFKSRTNFSFPFEASEASSKRELVKLNVLFLKWLILI